MIMLLYEERLFVKIQYQLMAKKNQPNIEQNICHVLNLSFKININGEESIRAKIILKWNWMWETFNEIQQILGKPWCGFGERYKPKCIRTILPLKENLILNRGDILTHWGKGNSPKWVQESHWPSIMETLINKSQLNLV